MGLQQLQGEPTPNHPRLRPRKLYRANSGASGASSNLYPMTSNYPHVVEWVAEMDEGELQALLDSFPSAGAGNQDELVTAVEARLAELKKMRI